MLRTRGVTEVLCPGPGIAEAFRVGSLSYPPGPEFSRRGT